MLRFVDGFDYYPSADLPKKWTAVLNDLAGNPPTLSASTGRFGTGTQALLLASYGSAGVSKLFDNQTTWYVGFAFKYTATGTSNFGNMLSFVNSSGNTQAIFSLAGGIITYTNGNRGTVVESPVTTLTSGIWNYLEFKIKFATSCAAGDVQIRINGALAYSITSGKNTIGDQFGGGGTINTANSIKFFGAGTSGGVLGLTAYLDDIYVCDSTGSVNNTFLGDVRIETILPNGAGSSTNFTPNTGTNWGAVSEVPEDGDTTYIASATVGDKDIYTVGDLSSTPTAVYGIQISTIGRKDDAGTRVVSPIVKSGGTEYDHSSTNPFGLGDGYTEHLDIWESNPNGTVPWTGTSINALNVGVKVVT